MIYLQITVGFVLLFIGGEALVRGGVALAQRLSVSPLVIGITIVGFGTSAPELVVSVNAALSGSPGISVGNVVGSNLANMLLILGVAAMIWPIACNPTAVRRDGLFVLAVTVIFVLFGIGGRILAWHGMAMLGLLTLYLWYSIRRDSRSGNAEAERHREEAEEVGKIPENLWAMLGYIALGLAALWGGSELLVDGAVTVARSAGISEEVIGLTMVALGTSLPELAVAVVAAYKKKPDICLGNVLGSNLFNLLGVLGVASLFVPVPFADRIITFDLWVLLGVTALLMPIMMSGYRISRIEGTVMLVAYFVYVGYQYFGPGGA